MKTCQSFFIFLQKKIPERHGHFFFFLSLQDLVWFIVIAQQMLAGKLEVVEISLKTLVHCYVHICLYNSLMKSSRVPIIVETKAFPVIIHCSYRIKEKERNYFFLFCPVVQQMLFRSHMDAKLHAWYTICLVLDKLKRKKRNCKWWPFSRDLYISWWHVTMKFYKQIHKFSLLRTKVWEILDYLLFLNVISLY